MTVPEHAVSMPDILPAEEASRIYSTLRSKVPDILPLKNRMTHKYGNQEIPLKPLGGRTMPFSHVLAIVLSRTRNVLVKEEPWDMKIPEQVKQTEASKSKAEDEEDRDRGGRKRRSRTVHKSNSAGPPNKDFYQAAIGRARILFEADLISEIEYNIRCQNALVQSRFFKTDIIETKSTPLASEEVDPRLYKAQWEENESEVLEEKSVVSEIPLELAGLPFNFILMRSAIGGLRSSLTVEVRDKMMHSIGSFLYNKFYAPDSTILPVKTDTTISGDVEYPSESKFFNGIRETGFQIMANSAQAIKEIVFEDETMQLKNENIKQVPIVFVEGEVLENNKKDFAENLRQAIEMSLFGCNVFILVELGEKSEFLSNLMEYYQKIYGPRVLYLSLIAEITYEGIHAMSDHIIESLRNH